jgi:hypothetical protein
MEGMRAKTADALSKLEKSLRKEDGEKEGKVAEPPEA